LNPSRHGEAMSESSSEHMQNTYSNWDMPRHDRNIMVGQVKRI